jgi:hypothetical protein
MIDTDRIKPMTYEPIAQDTCVKTNPRVLQSASDTQPSLGEHIIGARNSKTISEWHNLKSVLPGALMVHGIQSSFTEEDTRLYRESAQSVFSTWDIFSTSLVNVSSIKAFSKSGDDQERTTGCYSNVGIVLDVPAQNIYGTHGSDVYVENHIGVANKASNDGVVENPHALADHLKSGINELGEKVDGGFSRFVPPAQLLQETEDYNEVLVIGRPHVNLHSGEKPTGEVKAVGIWAVQNYKMGDPDLDAGRQAYLADSVEKLKLLNPGLPVITINENAEIVLVN